MCDICGYTADEGCMYSPEACPNSHNHPNNKPKYEQVGIYEVYAQDSDRKTTMIGQKLTKEAILWCLTQMKGNPKNSDGVVFGYANGVRQFQGKLKDVLFGLTH